MTETEWDRPLGDFLLNEEQRVRARLKPNPRMATQTRVALTGRELDVLRRIADGNSNEQIAASLGLAVQTIKSHVSNLLFRMDANNRAHAVAIGYQHGYLLLAK